MLRMELEAVVEQNFDPAPETFGRRKHVLIRGHAPPANEAHRYAGTLEAFSSPPKVLASDLTTLVTGRPTI